MTPDTDSGDLTQEPAQRCFFRWVPQGRPPPRSEMTTSILRCSPRTRCWRRREMRTEGSHLPFGLLFSLPGLALCHIYSKTCLSQGCRKSHGGWDQVSIHPRMLGPEQPPASPCFQLDDSFETDVACEFSNCQCIPSTLCSTEKILALFKPRSYTSNKTLELVLVLALLSLSATATKKIRSKVLLLGIIMYLEPWSYITVSHTCKPVTLPKLFLLSPLL